MKKKIFLPIFFILFLSNAIAQIDNEEILMNFFTQCNQGKADGFSIGSQIEYCGCATNQISKNMTLEELMQMGLEMYQNSENMDDETALRYILNNKKMSDMLIKCMTKIYE